MEQFTEEITTQYGDDIPTNEVLVARLQQHLLAKLRVDLLSHLDPDDVVAQLKNRDTILRLMGDDCPEIQDEMHQIAIGFEDRILQAMKEYLGVIHHQKKITTIEKLIKNPRSRDPLLKDMVKLFKVAENLPGFRKSRGPPKAYLKNLFIRTTRKFSDIPVGIFEIILQFYVESIDSI